MINAILRRIEHYKYGCNIDDYSYLTKGNYVGSKNTEIRLNLVIGTINKKKMYGGLTTAINLFNYFCSVLECDKRIIVTDDFITPEILNDYKEYVMATSDEELDQPSTVCNYMAKNGRRGILSVRKHDIMLTTYWTTHFIISDVLNFQNHEFGVQNKIIYLIQDYEPGFFKWSSEYFLVDSTYKSGNIIAVFNSLNLMNYFKKLDYKFDYEMYFDPKLNRTLLSKIDLIKTTKKKKQVIVYGRPNIGRNCFPLIIKSLKFLIENNKFAEDWSFISVGGNHKDIPLRNGKLLKAKGKLSLDEYANTLAESSVGLSLMCSPHPSYPPLEMAAYGVKTITSSFVCKDLSSYSKNIISLNIVNFETVKSALAEAMENDTINNEVNIDASYLDNADQFYKVGEQVKGILQNILQDE